MKNLNSYEKARRYIETHSLETDEAKLLKRKLHPGPCITISRQTGIGAEKIGEKLIDYFQQSSSGNDFEWGYFDKNLIEKISEEHGLPLRFDKFLEVGRQTHLNSFFGELLGVHPSKIKLLHKQTETILQLAEYGNVIIVGRGANIITSKLKNTLHVRLVAPLHHRVENCIALYSLSKKEAHDFIEQEDSARGEFIKTYFHKQIDDPLLYHVVINTHLLSFEEIARMIGYLVVKKFPNMFKLAEEFLE